MENILIDLMTVKCHAMKNEKSPCFKKGKCDGLCADFYVAMDKIINELTKNSKN